MLDALSTLTRANRVGPKTEVELPAASSTAISTPCGPLASALASTLTIAPETLAARHRQQELVGVGVGGVGVGAVRVAQRLRGEGLSVHAHHGPVHAAAAVAGAEADGQALRSRLSMTLTALTAGASASLSPIWIVSKSARSGREHVSPELVHSTRKRTNAASIPYLSIGSVRSATQLDATETSHSSRLADSVSRT
jgi:hypothetical protein